MEEKVKYGKDEGGLKDDSVAKMEKVIASDLAARGKDMLNKLVDALDGDNAVRMLRIIENIAKHHRELIAAMAGGDTFRSKFATSDDTFGLGGLSVGASYGNQEENFGAQALKGLVEGLKDIRPKNNRQGAEVRDLVEAMDLARSRTDDDSMRNIAMKINEKLTRMLDEDVPEKKN